MKGIRIRVRAAAARLRSMAASPSGWASVLLANLLVSMAWIVPLGIGWYTGDATFYVASAGIAAFMALPLSFSWLLVYVVAERVERTINYRKKSKKEDNEK